ncbi:MAG: GNAT family N-acetyltransferase [Candidatus Thorarchaeota archaeon]
MNWKIPEDEGPAYWLQLKIELVRFLGDQIQLICPTVCDDQCFSWFHSLEEEDFRFELQYTREEITERLEYPEVLFFFIINNEVPEILVLGYKMRDYEPLTFYLDTLAVRQRGRGIGHVVMRFIVKRAQNKRYQAIILDTEEKNEKGIPLQYFYQVHGFETIARTNTGDLKMLLDLTTSDE